MIRATMQYGDRVSKAVHMNLSLLLLHFRQFDVMLKNKEAYVERHNALYEQYPSLKQNKTVSESDRELSVMFYFICGTVCVSDPTFCVVSYC